MGQTVRRQPGEVDIPSKDYIYHKNLIGFKGLDTRENPLVTDPLSCSDAENVWVDSNGNLTTRPRLQYVRQNLKHANAEVVNVIYTDNAYWTLYIKDGVYYLTRTDLATDTETDFTIPTIASPKIAITEYKNVYYLGCSAGYYSCNAGNIAFQKVSGYIPVGHIGESGYVYDEARNILNNQIRVAQTGHLPAVYPDGTVHGSFGKYVVYSQLNAAKDKRRVAIWDIIDGSDVEEIRSNLPSSELSQGQLSVYADDNIICIALFENITPSFGHTEFRLRMYKLDNGTLIPQTYYTATSSDPICALIRNELLQGDRTKQNTFCGLYHTSNAAWTALKWSTENGHVLLHASYKYLQWDYAHAANRSDGTVTTTPDISTGQYCYEALQFDITAIAQLGTLYIKGDTIAENGYVQRIGLVVYAEHTNTSLYYALQHIALPSIAVSPSTDYMLIALYSADDVIKCIASNSSKYRNSTSNISKYVSGADEFTVAAYPRSDMTYQRSTLPINRTAIVATVIGLGLHKYDLYTIATTDKILNQYSVEEELNSETGNLVLTIKPPAPKVTDIQTIGSVRQAPQLFTASSATGVYLYAAPTARQATVTTISTELSTGFSGAYGVLTYNAERLKSYAYTPVYSTQVLRQYTLENPSLRGVLFLDNVYWWFGKTNIYGTANEDLTYMPESRKLDAPSEIRNWVRLTDTSFLVFCESDTCLYYKDTSSGLWLRTVLNLPLKFFILTKRRSLATQRLIQDLLT